MQQVVEIDGYEPDWNTECEVCGATPTVTAVKNGITVAHWGMCGPCTFGTAAALDPDWWNSDDD